MITFKNMKKLLLLALLIVFSCEKEELPSYLLAVSAGDGGSVSTTGGDYAEGKISYYNCNCGRRLSICKLYLCIRYFEQTLEVIIK